MNKIAKTINVTKILLPTELEVTTITSIACLILTRCAKVQFEKRKVNIVVVSHVFYK